MESYLECIIPILRWLNMKIWWATKIVDFLANAKAIIRIPPKPQSEIRMWECLIKRHVLFCNIFQNERVTSYTLYSFVFVNGKRKLCVLRVLRSIWIARQRWRCPWSTNRPTDWPTYQPAKTLSDPTEYSISIDNLSHT